MDTIELAWAAFRTALISPLLTGEIPSGQREAYMQSVAAEERLFPDGKRAKVSVRTLWRWYHRMRAGGFQGIVKQPRSDRGKPRRAIQARVIRAVELKREQPMRSDRVINKILKAELGSELPSSTVYRHLRIQGATRKQLGVAKEKVRCRWTRELPNSLWQGDFEHGPVVLVDAVARQTRLSAWIDSHSRYIVAARYYLNENTGCLVDSLLRAWSSHGSSVQLYADNGKVYHSKALEIACGQLGIRKLHRPPREPQPGGLIERFFKTVQSQFEAEVRAMSKSLSLTELNRAFTAWLISAYHEQIHRETNQTPRERYFKEDKIHRPLAIDAVLPIFHLCEYRTVDSTFSDVILRNIFYQVDAKYRGLRLRVHFDPFIDESGMPDRVELYSEQGVSLGIGRRYERQHGAHEPPLVGPAKKLEESAYIRTLLQSSEQIDASKRHDGIAFNTAMAHGRLTRGTLCQVVAQLLGRKGGLSGLSPDEIAALDQLYNKHPQVQQSHVRTAFEQTSPANFSSMLWDLQCLLAELPKGNP